MEDYAKYDFEKLEEIQIKLKNNLEMVSAVITDRVEEEIVGIAERNGYVVTYKDYKNGLRGLVLRPLKKKVVT